MYILTPLIKYISHHYNNIIYTTAPLIPFHKTLTLHSDALLLSYQHIYTKLKDNKMFLIGCMKLYSQQKHGIRHRVCVLQYKLSKLQGMSDYA